MTVNEAARHILGDDAFDCALPQTWLDETATFWANRCQDDRQEAYQQVSSSFVWAYDEQAGCLGRPCALSSIGNNILAACNDKNGSCYPLTPPEKVELIDLVMEKADLERQIATLEARYREVDQRFYRLWAGPTKGDMLRAAGKLFFAEQEAEAQDG